MTPPLGDVLPSPPSSLAGPDPALRSSLPATAPAPGDRPSAAGERVRVLVADDDRVSRRLLAGTVAGWGYEVSEASDGARALAALVQPDAPRLALIDWEMPGMSGVEVCRLLRARPSAPYVYLLLCTGRDTQRHLIDGLSAGADDYVRKPFDPQELEVRLRAGRRVVVLQRELLAAQAELERRALTDSLTRAKNRGAIMDMLGRELARSRRTGRPLSIVLTDVDHFKRVNDTHGHPAGDAVLAELVRRLRREIRSHDDVGRYGGEEFLVVLPECPTIEAARVARRFREALHAEGWETPAGTLAVTASFGVAGTDQGAADLSSIVSAADGALYVAKGLGRDRVVVFEPG